MAKSKEKQPAQTSPLSADETLNEIGRMLDNRSVRADFAEMVYPDNSAMVASHKVTDLLERNDSGTLPPKK